MLEISFEGIKPFVRYARELDRDIFKHQNYVRAYDSRLLYCTDGQGKIYIGSSEYHVKAGMLFIWKGGVTYKYDTQESRKLKFIALNFDFLWTDSTTTALIAPDKAQVFNSSLMTEDVFFSDCSCFNTPLVLEDGTAFYKRLVEINKLYGAKKQFSRLRTSSILADILAEIACLSVDGFSAENKTVDAILGYMKQNLTHELSNEAIGKLFKYHPNYINQLFVRYTGKSLHKNLTDLRLSRAMELLQGTNLTLAEICRECGYCDIPHFSKAFKKKTGYPPSDFRML